MTTTYRQPGEVASVTVSATTAAGTPVRVGLRGMGIAAVDLASGATGSVALTGVHSLKKNSSDAITQGSAVWWDATAGELINEPVVGSLFIGRAWAGAIAAATTGEVQLAPFSAEGPRVLTLAATGAETLTVADFASGNLTVLCANSEAKTVNLPGVATVPRGALLRVRKTGGGANAITLDGNSSETVGGSATYAAIDADNDTAMFVNTGAAWALVDAQLAS
jgi:predicted RecA/RadA family phage recombinase